MTLHLFAGDSIETPSVVAVDLERGEIETIQTAAGDDTTTRASALMDERAGGSGAGRFVSPIHWTSKMFLHTSHRSLTSDPMFTDNVLSLLLESPPAFGIESTNVSKRPWFTAGQAVTRLPPVPNEKVVR